jgi:CRISPR-associated protein Csh2
MSYNGIVVINAKNANFNADFDGMPRRLPDGTIYATDKVLKYCIREYWAQKELPVFVRRTQEFQQTKDGKKQFYYTLEENYKNKTKRDDIPKDDDILLEDLKKFIDIRLFGVVFAAVKNKNISLTGPCQISYGINRYEKSGIYTSTILSPYRNPNEKSTESQHTTIGEQSRADDIYYVYDVCLNLNSAEHQGITITNEDIENLKDALMYSVNSINSTTMFGCETVSMLWFRNKHNKVLNNLNTLVDVYQDEDKTIVDYTKVLDHIKNDVEKESIEKYQNKVGIKMP